MKNLKTYILGFAALVAAAGFTSCQDHFDAPNSNQEPVADIKANTTIADFKELMWQDGNNYCETVYTKEWYATTEAERTEAMKTEGTHIIVEGRVISSDYAGNCFKYITLQDETGALNFSINSYNLYLNYRMGQKVVVDLTGLNAGKYRGLLQVGFPSYNSSLPGYETSFMAPELFSSHAQLDGWPKPAQVDTINVERFSELGVTPTELRKWQSQIVRFNNVEFVPNATTPTLSTYHSSGVTQQIKDAEGNTLDVRTSGYANFWTITLPEEKCDVVALLGYYVNLAGSGGWQLTLLDANSILNVGNPTVPKGSESNPYNVLEAIAYQVNGEGYNGWVKGYIVGTVGPEVENVSSNADIEWTAEPTLGNTLVIGQTADTKDIAECLVVALPQGSDLRKYGALRENPTNYLKAINIKGSFKPVMGTHGLADNNGTTSEFQIEGVDVGPVTPVDGDGSEDKPYNVAQIVAMNPQSTTEATATGVWVEGYIVGSMPTGGSSTTLSGTNFSTADAATTNIVLGPSADCTQTSQCIGIQLPTAKVAPGVRDALNLSAHPENLGAKVKLYGDVMKYCGGPAIKNTSKYVLDGTTPTPTPDPSGSVVLLQPNDANGAKDWTFDNVNKPSSLQYDIWSWKSYNDNYCLYASAYTTPAQASEAWACSPIINLTKASSVKVSFEHAAKTTLRTLCGFAVRVEGATAWNMLQIPTWPEAVAWTYAGSGTIDLSAYAGKKVQVAFKYASSSDGADTWQVRNLTFTGDNITVEGAGSVTPTPDPTPTDTYKGQFNSFNNSQSKSSYGTYTNSTGWTATNCNILGGLAQGATEQNPRFAFIGDASTLAPTLNGKTSAPGELLSPVITGGIKKLTFNYGLAYSDTKCRFTVQILQGGNVVAEKVIEPASVTTKTAYDFALDLNVSGSFQIKIVNNCPSGADANKDRVSIWNLTWE